MTNPRAARIEELNAQWATTYGADAREWKDALRDRITKEREKILSDDEAPLIKDILDEGIIISSVWDLVNTGEKYPQLIATLARHASLEYLEPVREGIFRALTVREAKASELTILISEWETRKDKNDFTRWALANAIAYVAKGVKWLPTLGNLITGDNYESQPFIRRLRKSESGKQILLKRMKELEI